ncbi:MAG: recombinase family protein [Defluviitaleaceae bacterium]|nr:recombinase family protein [Defluviitaleaceae bacterium]MCL2261597.1 recombinase family protein [Defluviitaleaceae bacterium]
MNIYTMRNVLNSGKTIFDLPLRVTFYARVSTGSDEQANSLANQIGYYSDFIKSISEWTFIDGYIDEALSGTSVTKRESFLQMIEDAKKNKFDFIITKEISRFSRSTLDSIKYTQELLAVGVGVLFQSDNINTLMPDSELRLTIMSSIAQDEVRKLSERINFGMQRAIANGIVHGNNNIWGYEKQNGKLVIVEEEAEIVRRIFTLYATENIGVRTISLRLSKEGMNNKNGNPLTMSTIRRIITNPKYKGYYCGNKSHKIDYRLETKIAKDKSEWVMYKDEDTVPPIVTEELWEKANAVLAERSIKQSSPNKTSYQNKYTYSGKIICGEHDRPFHHDIYRYPSGNKEVWRCRSKDECNTPVIYTTEADAIVKEVYAQYVQDKDNIIEALVNIYSKVVGTSKGDEQLNKLGLQVEAVKKKKDKLLNLNIDGRISDEEFQERNDGFNNEISALNGKIAKVHENVKKSKALTKTMDEIRKVLLGELDFNKGFNNSIVDALIERIEIHKTAVKNILDVKVQLKAIGQTKILSLKKTSVQGQVGSVANATYALKPDTRVCYRPHNR